MNKHLILASGSPRRRELLQELDFTLTIMPADVDEAPRPDETPLQLVERLAQSKATACREVLLAQGEKNMDPIVAADTIVWDRGLLLGKPADAVDAARMLRELSGRTHYVSTGVCIVAPDGRVRSFTCTSDVTFYELTDAQVDAYVATGEPLDKAGAYGIQGKGRLLVREIRGDYFNIVGLPVAQLYRELEAMGLL